MQVTCSIAYPEIFFLQYEGKEDTSCEWLAFLHNKWLKQISSNPNGCQLFFCQLTNLLTAHNHPKTSYIIPIKKSSTFLGAVIS